MVQQIVYIVYILWYSNNIIIMCFITETFDRDICRFICLVKIWKQQAQECNISLPNLTTTIDTSLPDGEQWEIAVRLWTALREAWAIEASRRGINVASTPELGVVI